MVLKLNNNSSRLIAAMVSDYPAVNKVSVHVNEHEIARLSCVFFQYVTFETSLNDKQNQSYGQFTLM